MKITIGGAVGSGKSTIAKMLAKKLGWPHYYMGGLRREKAREKGITLAEYNRLGETDPSTDREVDEYQKRIGEEKDNFIMEGRTSWYFIPDSIKIYIDVDEKEGARRVWEDLQKNPAKRNEDKKIKTIKDALASHKQRKKSDSKRYKKYYGINIYDGSHYDFTLDTTNLTKKDAFNKIYEYVRKRLNNIDKNKKLLYP